LGSASIVKHIDQGPVGILLVTHLGLGSAMLAAAAQVLGKAPEAAQAIEVAYDEAPTAARERILEAMKRLDSGAGVLVLSDLYGASPHNFALACAGSFARVVSGLNLGMLLSCLAAQRNVLSGMVTKACQAGLRGIRNGEPKC